MAAAASGKPLPDATRRVLEEQVHLIHAQCGELKLRKIGEGVRAALWAILAIAAAGIVALIIAIVIRASRSDALVVESFRVPPSLAAKGPTGEVVATQGWRFAKPAIASPGTKLWPGGGPFRFGNNALSSPAFGPGGRDEIANCRGFSAGLFHGYRPARPGERIEGLLSARARQAG